MVRITRVECVHVRRGNDSVRVSAQMHVLCVVLMVGFFAAVCASGSSIIASRHREAV